MSTFPPAWPGAHGSASSAENVHNTTPDPLQTTEESGKKKQQQQQSRQLLSCTKCRERKVKCDRTKPCSACCARGQPKECQFVVAEGGDYGPIQQSYEIRKLRAENLRLKERLRAVTSALSDDSDEAGQSDRPVSKRARHRRPWRAPLARQKAFKNQDLSDNLYFGSPGLASVINEFASLNFGATSLSHTMPRGQDVYFARSGPAYPFATMWPAYPQACIPALLQCLPPQEDLFAYLDAFQKRSQSCSFPHTPEEITKREVERFLSDSERNAQLYPDMLALLFAALAQGSQNGVFDKSGGKWVEGAMQAEAMKGDVYIAASMQALRMASFMNRPTLLGIQALIMMGPYLTNSGRFLDAWTLFGTTIRLAHSVGLHRNPKYLDPAPPLRECAIRQTLWWWMLHMDQQYSMTLGRPLGISGIGDCPPPEPLTTNPTVLRLEEFVDHFTLLARQILSSDKLTNAKIDEFTDRLRRLWDTMPEMVRFDETWLDREKEIPEWPLDAIAAVFYGKTHNYLILLNRQRISPVRPPRPTSSTPFPSPPLPNSQQYRPSPTTAQPSPASQQDKEPLRGRPLVLSSSLALLNAFLFFYTRVPAAMICWTMGQQAFNACMIILLDAIETCSTNEAAGEEVDKEKKKKLRYLGRVEQAYAVFVELDKKGVHKLAALAVERISWGMEMLRLKEEALAQTQAQAAALGAEAQVSNPAIHPGGGGAGYVGPQPMLLDTVMGNTGMWLLEDPGLQSFVPESFTPLAWGMAGRDLRVEREAEGSGSMGTEAGGGAEAGTWQQHAQQARGGAGAGAGEASTQPGFCHAGYGDYKQQQQQQQQRHYHEYNPSHPPYSYNPPPPGPSYASPPPQHSLSAPDIRGYSNWDASFGAGHEPR